MLFSSILQRSIEANRLILSVVSGIIVVIVGVYIFLQNPVTQIRRNRVGKTTLWRDFASMFGITLTNFIYVIPYIMIFFTMFKVSTLGVRHMLTINHVAGIVIAVLGIYTILSNFIHVLPNVH